MAYTIQSGDTLSQLALNNKTTVADLMKANPNITDANKIYAGASLNLPTAPNAVPTKAPSVPTPVVSSTPAIAQVGKMTDTINTATQTLTAAQAEAKQRADIQAQLDAQNKAKTPTQTTPLTPEQELMKQPDAGYQWVYDKATGEKTQMPIGSSIPSTYSTVDVNTAPASETVQTSTSTIKKFNDGSYGEFDPAGKYIGPALEKNFTDVKKANEIQSEIDAINNGTHPLTAQEQGIIDSIKDYYTKLSKQQELENKNLEGGTTAMSYLLGISGGAYSINQLNQVISDGSLKIQQLNNEMNDKVNAAMAAIKADDLKGLKISYDNYTKAADDRQQYLKDINNKLAAGLEARRKAEVEDRNYQLDLQKFGEKVSVDKANLELNRLKTKAYLDTQNNKIITTKLINTVAEATGGMSAYNNDGTLNKANIAAIKSKLPPGIADTIVAVATYGRDINSIKDAHTRDVVGELASRFFPTYDQRNYKPSQNYYTDYGKTSPTSLGGQLITLNAMASHLSDLTKAVQTIDTSSYGFINALETGLATKVGPLVGMGGERRTATGQLNTLKQIFSEENLKYLKGAAGGETSVARMEALFSGSLSKEEAEGTITSFIKAINAKTQDLLEQQKAQLGYIDPNKPIMIPSAAITLDKLSDSLGIQDTNFEGLLNQTSEGKVYLYTKSNGIEAYNSLQNQAKDVIGRKLTPDELITTYPVLFGGDISVPIDTRMNNSNELPPLGGETSSESTIDNQ